MVRFGSPQKAKIDTFSFPFIHRGRYSAKLEALVAEEQIRFGSLSEEIPRHSFQMTA